MKNSLVIFRKELKDVLRDRRTVYAMILAPVLIYPILITAFTQIMRVQSEKAQEKVLVLGIVGQALPPSFERLLEQQGRYQLIEGLEEDSASMASMLNDSLDAIFSFPHDFDQQLERLDQGSVTLYYRGTDDDIRGRLEGLSASMQQYYSAVRMEQMNINPDLIQPVRIERIDMSSSREKLGQTLGAIFPYFFIIFCFLGCMYPAIDLGAGEKERGTMETLLSSPASRLDIFLGKLGVVFVGGMTSAVLAIGSLALSIKFNTQSFGDLPEEFSQSLSSMLQFDTILLLILLLLPVAVFFASALLTLSITAQSFKEAQSLISPAMILVLLPSMVGFVPGIHLNNTNALIPIFNVSLAAKEVLAGTLQMGPFIITVLSLLALAGLGIVISLRFFKSERNVLPT